MTRPSFLTFSSVVALTVAAFALGYPSGLLAGKGVAPSPALLVWIRELGVLILAVSVTTFLVRKQPDSITLKGILIGNALLHFGLLPIELLAFSQGVIPKLSGVLPNSLLHALLGAGFVIHARRIDVGLS